MFLILFVQALTGALIGQFTGALEHQSADVLVYSARARKNLEGSVVAPATVDEIAAVPGVAASGPFGEGTFSVRAANQLRDAALIGYEPGKPGAPTTLKEGRLPTAPFEVVASSRNRNEGFGIGDHVQLEKGGQTLTVVGLASDINYSVLPTMFTTFDTYATARRDANPGATAVWPSAVAAAVAPGASARAVRGEINVRIQGVETLTRGQAVSESPGVASVDQSLGAVVFLCFFVVAIVAGLFFPDPHHPKGERADAAACDRDPGRRAGPFARRAGRDRCRGRHHHRRARDDGRAGREQRQPRRNPHIATAAQTGAIVFVLAIVASLSAIRRVLRIEPIRATIPRS